MLRKDNWNIIRLESCDSTNSYIKQLKVNRGLYDRTALVTNLQRTGRGQGTNSWYSSEGRNLLVSFFRKPSLQATQSFMVTIVTSLALHHLLNEYEIGCKIKWPNDIYINNNKIAGVLIENSLMRGNIIDSIIGIGLNVNEATFPEDLPNPTSMIQEKGIEFNLNTVLDLLIKNLDECFEVLNKDGRETLYHKYISLLYRLDQWHLYKIDGATINGRIHGVELDGRLIFESDDGQLNHYLFGEIEYVI